MTRVEFERLAIDDPVAIRKTGEKFLVESKNENGFVQLSDKNWYPYRVLNRLPICFHLFNTVYGYDATRERWVYDCKYYLKDGKWWNLYTHEEAMPLDKWMMRDMRKIMNENSQLSLKNPLMC